MKRIKTLISLLIIIAVFVVNFSGAQSIEINICTTDYLNVREEPSINAKPIMSAVRKEKKRQLRIGDTVRILKRTDKEEEINGVKGRWAYIDPGYSDKTYGWVFDYYLAKEKDFTPLKSLPNNLQIKIYDEDTIFHYEFYKDGNAIQVIDSDMTLNGKIYIDNRNRIIIIKYDHEKNLTLSMEMRTFYYKDGKICVVGGGDPGDACAVVKK